MRKQTRTTHVFQGSRKFVGLRKKRLEVCKNSASTCFLHGVRVVPAGLPQYFGSGRDPSDAQRFVLGVLCCIAPFVLCKPSIAQWVEHLTVEICSNQMVPGSIPGRRIYVKHRLPWQSFSFRKAAANTTAKRQYNAQNSCLPRSRTRIPPFYHATAHPGHCSPSLII